MSIVDGQVNRLDQKSATGRREEARTGRACLVSFQFWPRVGGAEVQAEKQARQMQALGHG